MALPQVDKLEFLVLVDNVVEWISQLPSGFMHELPQHISGILPGQPSIDPMTGVPMLDFENYCCGAHGLSIWMKSTIGDKTYTVLMDAGPESKSIARNAKAMAVPLDELDAIVLSHWHADHSGGIPSALSLRSALSAVPLPPVKIDLHPARPLRIGIKPPPRNVVVGCLPPDPTFEQLEALGGRVDLHAEAHEIVGRDGGGTGVSVSGEVPRVTGFEVGLPGAVTWVVNERGEGAWVDDPLILNERHVVVDVKGKGLVVFSSCSHAGICNVLTDVTAKYARPVHMVVGGLHLVPVVQQPVQQTVDFLARRLQPTPDYVLPLHCTGLEPRARLKVALEERVIAAGVGMRVIVDSDAANEERIKAVRPCIIP